VVTFGYSSNIGYFILCSNRYRGWLSNQSVFRKGLKQELILSIPLFEGTSIYCELPISLACSNQTGRELLLCITRLIKSLSISKINA
jgi:hypothetical protein